MLPYPEAILWLLSPTALLWGLILLIRSARAQSRRRSAVSLGLISLLVGAAGLAGAYFITLRYHWPSSSEALDPLQVAALGVLFFATALTIWSYRGDRPRGRRRCPKCWYDMSGLALSCPECGHNATREKNLFRPRRRRRGILAGLFLMLAAYGLWVTPGVRANGPIAVIPSWVLIIGMPYLPDSCIGPGDLPGLAPSTKRPSTWSTRASLQSRLGDGTLSCPERWFTHARARGIVLSSPDLELLNRVRPFLSSESRVDPAITRALGISIMKSLASQDPAREREASVYLIFALESEVAALRPEDVRPYLPSLLSTFTSAESFIGYLTASYAVQAGPDADAFVPLIIKAVEALPDSSHASDQFNSSYFLRDALRTAARLSPNATQLVLDASSAPSVTLRRACAYAMGTPEAAARVGTTRLFDMLSDPDFGVQFLAASSLMNGALPPEQGIPAILRWSMDPKLNTPQIINSLARFDPAILAPHAALLVPLLAHPSSEIRIAAATRLAALADNPALDLTHALEPLQKFAKDDSTPEGRAATYILDRYRTAPGRPQPNPSDPAQ